jgi:hypothetical protein
LEATPSGRRLDTRLPVGIIVSLCLVASGCGGQAPSTRAAGQNRNDHPVASAEITSSDPSAEKCTPPSLRPTHLHWLQPGQQVPPPTETYDAEINRAQMSWDDPNGEAGVGLTVYPHEPAGNEGEPINILIYGVEGQLHSEDEGGNLVSISWDLEGEYCNFLELIVSAPGVGQSESVDQLMDVAESLR